MIKNKAVVLTHIATKNEPNGYYLQFVDADLASIKLLVETIVSDTLEFDLRLPEPGGALQDFTFLSLDKLSDFNAYTESAHGVSVSIKTADSSESLRLMIDELCSNRKLRNNAEFMKAAGELVSEQDSFGPNYYEQLVAYVQDLLISILWTQ